MQSGTLCLARSLKCIGFGQIVPVLIFQHVIYFNCSFTLIQPHLFTLRFKFCNQCSCCKNMKSTIDEGSWAMERVVYIHHLPAPTAFDKDPVPLKCVCLCAGPNRDVWKTFHTSDVIIYPQAHAPSCECTSTQSHTHTQVGTVYTPLKRHLFFLSWLLPERFIFIRLPFPSQKKRNKC